MVDVQPLTDPCSRVQKSSRIAAVCRACHAKKHRSCPACSGDEVSAGAYISESAIASPPCMLYAAARSTGGFGGDYGSITLALR
jgi:hypothetical protein